MQRLSNRNINSKNQSAPQVHYVDRVVEILVPAGPTEMIINTVEVPVDRIVEVEKIVNVLPPEMDLSPINGRLDKHEGALTELHNLYQNLGKGITTELEMQRRALIAIKGQRDVDRSRRLMLLRRIKKEHAAHKKMKFKLKLAIGACLVLSIVSLVVKL